MTHTIRTHTDQAPFLALPAEPWMADSSCGTSGNPDAWFPDASDPAKDAIRICGGCEVREACEEYAIRTRQTAGIWAGKRPRQLRRVAAKTRAES